MRDGDPINRLPSTVPPAAGQRAFDLFGAEVPDLLPFGLDTMMVIASRGLCAYLMGTAQVVGLVLASKLQRPNGLNDPALTNTINVPLAEHAETFGPLPDCKPHCWRQTSPPGFI